METTVSARGSGSGTSNTLRTTRLGDTANLANNVDLRDSVKVKPISVIDLKKAPPAQKLSDIGITYWSIDKWGMPGTPLSPAAKKDRSPGHTASRNVPLQQPDAAVFASLNDLETLMRAALAGHASFNEDERMVLTRQFGKEEATAKQEGLTRTQGLIDMSQFRHAWRKLHVKVSREQAQAMFVKYGCDAQGLLPFDMFTARLIGSPNRMLALEPEQKGPYKAGKDASFKGKITHRHCRKPLFPPSNWDGSAAVRSATKPKAGLHLEYAHGYDGKENTASNAYYTADGKIVYYVAAVGVVYDPVANTQSFFQGHNDDIRCLAMHPSRRLVATGQVASALDGTAECPYLCVWDPTARPPALITRIDFPAEGGSSRYIVALAFSPCGERLVVVTGDNRHTLYVYDWRKRAVIAQGVGHNGQPPQVYGVVWNPFDAAGKAIQVPRMFVTYGVKHVKFWMRATSENGPDTYQSSQGKFGRADKLDVLSACFLPSQQLVTGSPNGDILLWDTTGRSGCIGSCIKVLSAHGPGVLAPSLHDGQPCLQGVRGLCLRNDNTELVSAGADGYVKMWSLASGSVGGLVHQVQVHDPAEPVPASFRSVDIAPRGGAVLLGTQRCELWEVNGAVPEPLVFGHSADVYAVAWHPLKPHRFASASDSGHLYLWHAKQRRLAAKVTVGLPARCVAFSPDGVHLAVGTATGVIKVLLGEALQEVIATMADAKEELSELQYSPNGSKLAAGSHDNYIYVYDVKKRYQRIARCSGHSSYIKHLDWSLDSHIIQSSCGAYELLYFEATTGKKVQQNQRDTLWTSWTNSLGFPVMGIWPEYSDGTDVNSVCRSYSMACHRDVDPLADDGDYVVTSGDDGLVRLFNSPCVVEHAPAREYLGHSSHVMMVRFSVHNRWVVSAGGRDRAVFQWRVDKEAVEPVAPEVPAFVPEVVMYPARKRRAVVYEETEASKPPPPPQLAAVPPKTAWGNAPPPQPTPVPAKPPPVVYQITVLTSDIRGAATDCGVSIVMYGNGGKPGGSATSGELQLENSKDNFSRGRRDVFLVEQPADLGDLSRIRIGHDGKGLCPRWHLDRVEIARRGAAAPPVIFPCGMWFAKDEGDGKCMRILTPAAPGGAPADDPRRPRTYKVLVKTSDLKGAGTDATVSLTLYGTAGNSGPRALENSKDNFERGRTDAFEVAAAVGELQYIVIGHDNSGLGPSWHLQEVLISYPGGKETQFLANRWLATNEGNGQTSCTLYPTGSDNGAPPLHKYSIHVFTSDLKGAGTDASVSMLLHGAAGRASGPHCLDTSKNNFERGAEDVFPIESPDLGELSDLEVWHDNSGLGPGWHLDQVVVVDETAGGKSWTFPCERWLAKNEDDGQIRRRLVAMPQGDSTTYRVITYTSDLKGAGTDANVYIQLMGELEGKPLQGPRIDLASSKNNFERSAVDTFMLKRHKELGQLTHIRIGHDNKGLGAGWHLDHVEVVDSSTGRSFYFPCQQWLDSSEGDRKVERLLPVAAADPNALTCQYKVTVQTSDIKYAGTDADVFIEIMGKRDGVPTSSARRTLNSSKNDFERGEADVFNLTLPNLGSVERIIIGHNNKGMGADWHLHKVEVFSVNTGEQKTFYYDGWLSKDEPPYQLQVELLPTADGVAATKCRYSVKVYTSDVRGAGTDANVSCVIHGDQASTPLLELNNSKNNFERNAMDEFLLQSVDVGTFTKLQIGHDNSGLGAAWHLQHVEVVNLNTGQRATFIADQWLDAKSGTTTVVLLPSDGPGGSSKQRYRVSVQTADQRGAGTDRDVSIILVGDKGRSGELHLASSKDNFERNKLDEFLLDLGPLDLGTLQKVDIGFATQQSAAGVLGGLVGLSWCLGYVEVEHINTGQRVFFGLEDWIDGKRRRVELEAGKPGGSNTYKVEVFTSDIRGAGTDAGVCVCMFGMLDGVSVDSGTQVLDNSANNFERGATDTFTIKCKDLGDLTRLVVTSDGKGLGAAWHLSHVEITDTVRGIVTAFPCAAWFDGSKDPGSLQQTLLPAGGAASAASLVQYEVVVATADQRGAGTDANITIELHGDKDHTSPLRLETAANDFERGKRDVFMVRGPDVGELHHVVVAKDAAGVGSDWMLDQVEVMHPVLKKRSYFLCNDWFKGACSKTLLAASAADGAAAGGMCTYKVTVTTSDVRGAGTDADVSMVLYGSHGDTGTRKLDSSANNFERGQVDMFSFSANDVGQIQSLRIGHANNGLGAAWHLATVEVVNTSTGEAATFAHRGWIDKEHGLFVLLHPEGDGAPQDGKPLVEYTIEVVTSDERGAGTDANVFIELHGADGIVGDTRLENAHNNFERGRHDVFSLTGSDVGELQEVVVRHDNSGLGAAWHLQQINVINKATGATYRFPCGEWLQSGPGGDLAGCKKKLLAGNPNAQGPTNYNIQVHTSNERGAGTDADVFLTIFGANGDTGERKLDNRQNNFERGQVDEFCVQSANVGELQRICVRSSGSGLGAAWHLDKVIITSSADGKPVVFPCSGWLDNKTGLQRMLLPEGADGAAAAANLLKYRVVVYTADVRGAGTDANVSIELHGDKGFIGSTRLESSANDFERNNRDEFIITGTDVGELQSITIGHDNAGFGSDWMLQQVEVHHPVLDKTYCFACNDWLKVTKEAGSDGCKRTLTCGGGGAADGKVSYHVSVTTSDQRGAGTDADVFLTIFGPKGDTGERALASSANDFERGKTDSFFIQALDVGEVERIKIRSDGSGLGSDWHLAKVEVLHSGTGQLAVFLYNNWIDSKHGLEHVLTRVAEGDEALNMPALLEYKVSVYTSDVWGAGTDASVFIELHGDMGSVGQTRLETAHVNNFERGQRDDFTLRASDIGVLQRVVIWHDNAHPGADWHLQQVEVHDPSRNKTYYFPCNRWLKPDPKLGASGCRAELVAGTADAAAAGQPQMTTYKVVTQTGSERGAGTDANVKLTIVGALGDTGARMLDNRDNNFERGKQDTFFLQATNVGDLKQVQVDCDGSGLGAAWFLDFVTVTDTRTGAEAKFMCSSWFDAKNGWSKTLQPETAAAASAGATLDGTPPTLPPPPPRVMDYEVTVYTSDVSGAGTDGDVFLELTGMAGVLGERELKGRGNLFERNQRDVFTLQGPELGTLTAAKVRLVERGLGAAWHLKSIEVLNKDTQQVASFYFNNWLEKSRDNPTATVTLTAAATTATPASPAKTQPPSDAAFKAAQGAAQPDAAAGSSAVAQDLPEGSHARYRVTVVTSKANNAGTSASIWVRVEGPRRVLHRGELQLQGGPRSFLAGRMQDFFFEFPAEDDCGYPVTKFTIQRGESSLPGSDWLIEHVVLYDLVRNKQYKWKCSSWFNEEEGLVKSWEAAGARKRAQQQLQLAAAPPELNDLVTAGNDHVTDRDYKIDFVTSDKRGAGTNATPGLQLTDDKGVTWEPAIPAHPPQSTLCPVLRFQRGDADEFALCSAARLGDLVTVRVWQDGGGLMSAWHLESITVTHLMTRTRWLFRCGSWVPKGKTAADGIELKGVRAGSLSFEAPRGEAPVEDDNEQESGPQVTSRQQQQQQQDHADDVAVSTRPPQDKQHQLQNDDRAEGSSSGSRVGEQQQLGAVAAPAKAASSRSRQSVSSTSAAGSHDIPSALQDQTAR